jgi:hypothetical protein
MKEPAGLLLTLSSSRFPFLFLLRLLIAVSLAETLCAYNG